MKNKLYLYVLSFVLLLSLLTFSVIESHAESEEVKIPVSFTFSEDEALLNFVFTDGTGKVISETSIDRELPIFCDLYSLDDGYAAVFASCNPVVYRVVLYDMSFERLSSADITVPEASVPFVAGNCSFMKDENGFYYLAVLNLLNSPAGDMLFYADQVYILNADLQLTDSRMHIYDGTTANGMEVALLERDGLIYEMIINSAIDQADAYPLSEGAVSYSSESICISNAAEHFNALYACTESLKTFCLHGVIEANSDAADESDLIEECSESSESAEDILEELLLSDTSEAAEAISSDIASETETLSSDLPVDSEIGVQETSVPSLGEEVCVPSESVYADETVTAESGADIYESAPYETGETATLSDFTVDAAETFEQETEVMTDIAPMTDAVPTEDAVYPEETAVSCGGTEITEPVLPESDNE